MKDRAVPWFAVLSLILGAFVAGFLLGAWTGASRTSSRAVEAMAHMSSLRLALDMFRVDAGRLPTPAEGLAILRQPVLRGPYVGPDDGALLDPWGRPYLYQVSIDGVPAITTLGADGRAGGDGDDTDLTLSANLNPAFPPAFVLPTSTPSSSAARATP